MAGRTAAVPQAALLLILQAFIREKYMKEARQYNAVPCPTCKSQSPCKNYFCLECKTGGLCPVVFRGDDEHRNHPWLQVRQCSRQDSVLTTDLAHFMSLEALKHVHTCKLNGKETHCYLRSKQGSGHSSSARSSRTRAGVEKRCESCVARIRGSKDSTETFLVCSLQCLLNVARKRPELNLLAINDGAMKPMERPLFLNEKINLEKRKRQPPRMLETPTKTPIDEASQSPPATGDSPLLDKTHEDLEFESILATLQFPFEIDAYPMFGTPLAPATGDSPFLDKIHEALIEEPVVEAPPLPPATGDFPMSGFHEDLEVESILATLQFPFEIDAYPMFGTPLAPATGDSPFLDKIHEALIEEPVVEAPPLPPATGDFPMSGFHEDLEVESILATLQFPFEIDAYPMFGTPLAPATGDSPFLDKIHEALIEEPVVEAPPLPPATGDFPMSGFHEDLEVESILEALPFLLEIDAYPMFDTPAEASSGEGLPFPPATEDFPVSERREAQPAATADTIEMETLSLPLPDVEDLHFGSEWGMMDLEPMD